MKKSKGWRQARAYARTNRREGARREKRQDYHRRKGPATKRSAPEIVQPERRMSSLPMLEQRLAG